MTGVNSPLWFLARGTGVVSLVLLTVVVLLGILTRGGRSLGGLPRFGVAGLHRNVSLLTLVFLGIHIGTSVADPYAPIRLLDAVLPFASAYRPVWLGFGAVAFDLLIALVVTSLLRLRIGQRVWRGLHWLAYAAWPVAVVHGLGTGSDARTGWMLLTTVACVGAVLVALLWRIVDLSAATAARRAAAGGAAVAATLAVTGWAAAGPLSAHWARTAGTPTALLAHPASTTSTTSGRGASTTAPSGTGTVSGTWRQSDSRDRTTVTLTGALGGGLSGQLRIELHGRADDDQQGISLTDGTATLHAGGTTWSGPVDSLAGNQIGAQVTGPGGTVSLSTAVTLDSSASTFSGTVTAS